LDENLEPNFEKISERINRLPVGEELKKDMVEGVQFCKQFAVRNRFESHNLKLLFLSKTELDSFHIIALKTSSNNFINP
jgi:hypothetical protein